MLNYKVTPIVERIFAVIVSLEVTY